MDSNGVYALIGAVVLAFIIRALNMVSQWLAHLLKVDEPEPIALPVDQSGLTAVRSHQTPEAPSTAAPEHPESPSQHP